MEGGKSRGRISTPTSTTERGKGGYSLLTAGEKLILFGALRARRPKVGRSRDKNVLVAERGGNVPSTLLRGLSCYKKREITLRGRGGE